MLEHSAMYLNVTPPYEDNTSFFPDFYTRLGPCELQDPVWAKMSALAAGVKKKRNKSETKPQAQINKCNNEKRRREQENIYIEELAELISANFADMSSLSVKPDKCAILQETVNQIRSIKQRESAAQSSDPVQQGEVSSSRPNILSNEVYGPLLLEALEGFLFVVNSEGRVEHVTENVSTYIRFTRDEVLGKSIYNIIHHGDHTRFSSCLLPMTLGWPNEPTSRSRSFNIRLLVKPPDDLDESVEEKQQRSSSYEVMHISSTQLRDPVSVSDEDGSDSGPCLLCVASRISHREKTSYGIEQFTTKLDTLGKIICVDTSGVSQTLSQHIKKELMDRLLKDLVSEQEVHKITSHLHDTLSTGQSSSDIYRLQIGPDKFVQVKTKSKLFKTNPYSSSADTDFIMATHSIIGENESIGPTDPGGGGSNNNSSVGGPLMTSVVNGTTKNGGVGTSVNSGNDSTSSNSLLSTTNVPSFSSHFPLDNDFFELYPTSTWELDSGWEARPDSRQSVTPVSTPTPRPPSNPSFSPATTVSQSPLTHFVTQPSPTMPNPSTPSDPYHSTFTFSTLSEQNYQMEELKDTKANVLDESVAMVDSGKLRSILTTPTKPVETETERNRDIILKGLLNQTDEDTGRTDNRNSPRGMCRSANPGPSDIPKNTSAAIGNNMLRELLNPKSDDDDLEVKAGMKKSSELLQRLLKPECRDNEEEKKNDSQDDTLLHNLGLSLPSEPGRPKKRPSDDPDDSPSKRQSDGSQVTSSGPSTGSKLSERNKMLASLLAKQPPSHLPIPPIPASVLSATPQEKLPRITDPNKNLQMNMLNQNIQQQNLLNNARMNTAARMATRQQNYPNTVNNLQRTNDSNKQSMSQVNQNSFASAATSSTDNNSGNWDTNQQSSADPVLSDILDQVIDIVPDDLMHILDNQEAQHSNNYQNALTETMAINIIQKSLMQCESAVRSPSSPTLSLSATPPAYSSSSMTSNNQFPPPPNYSQAANYKRVPTRPGATQYVGNVSGQQQQQHYILHQNQQRRLIHQQQQQEQKRRLLQQQQQQQLLIPSNAAAELNSMQNIDSLLNNTVAPNVSLQRSSSVPESQLSPNFTNQINQQNQRVASQPQQPFSPHSQVASPIAQQSFSQTTLSPRQAYPQGNSNNTNWQQSQARLSVQQNPMLNAQLTRPSQQQQQRSINSPGTVTNRHSPFPSEQFQAPSSPNSGFNQAQYLRLQRTNSAPTATTQLPGGLGSPRPYTGREHLPHSYPNLPPPHHPMMYHQQDSQYCYDQSSLQLAYNGQDRGRAPPHLQPGVPGSGPASDFVRQELRAVVGARTAHAQPGSNRQPQQLLSQQQQVSDLDALGINFEMSTGASDSPKLWCAMGSEMGSMSPQPATSRTSMEEARQGDHKSSLLQKLLSE